jgi:hypothetical protein
MDTTPLRLAYRALLDAAETVAASGETSPAPPLGEWNAEQILAHIAIVTAATTAVAAAVASGANTTYDNRIAQDSWTIAGVIALAGGNAGLRERIRGHGEVLCALGGSVLSPTELNRPVPTLLISKDTVLVDRPLPLSEIIAGLAEVELPGHTRQLLALLPDTDGAGFAG